MMNNSFALIFDGELEYKKLHAQAREFFGSEFHDVSTNLANSINTENKFILRLTPSKMDFMFVHDIDSSILQRSVNLIRKFLITYFQNQLVGIQFYGDIKQNLFNDLDQVETVVL